MRIRYKGGKTSYKVSVNRIPYIFSVENNRILDITDQNVINYIFSLDNREEFEVVVEEKKEEPKITKKIEIEPIKKVEKEKIIEVPKKRILKKEPKKKKGGKR